MNRNNERVLLIVLVALILFVVAVSVVMADNGAQRQTMAQVPPTPTAPMPWHPTPPPTPAAYPGPEPTVTPSAYPGPGAVVVGHDMNPSHPGPHDHSVDAFTPDDAGIWAWLWDLFTN